MRLLMLRARVISSAYSNSPPNAIPPGDGGDFDGKMRQLLANVVDSSIALDIGIERKYDLGDLFFRNPLHQVFDGELVGAHAIQWRNDAAQYMVNAVELLRAFNGDHVANILHHTKQLLVARPVGADVADDGVRHVQASRTKPNLLFHPRNGLAELVHLGGVLFHLNAIPAEVPSFCRCPAAEQIRSPHFRVM